MQSLSAFFSIAALSLFALFSWAHEAALDEIGCHADETTGAYHCHAGRMAGREFITKNEALDALQALEEQVAGDIKQETEFQPEAAAAEVTKSTPASAALKLISWNLNRVGKELFEYDRIANVLAGADMVSLQEVEFSSTGETSLLVIASILQKKLGERVCKGWFRTTTGERARHAFLWKDRVIGLVEKSGAFRESCTEAPEVILLDEKKPNPAEPFVATFYLKARKQMFVIASVHLPEQKDKKKSVKDVVKVFRRLIPVPWPVIVAGDFRASFKGKDKEQAFAEARKSGYVESSISRLGPASSSGFWTKNVEIVDVAPVNLYEWFSDLQPGEVDRKIATQFPLVADVSFSKKEGDVLKMELIKRKKQREDHARSREPGQAAPKAELKPFDVHEDIESEAVEP